MFFVYQSVQGSATSKAGCKPALRFTVFRGGNVKLRHWQFINFDHWLCNPVG